MLETEQRKPVVERQGYNTMSAGGTGGSAPQLSQEQKDRWTQPTSPGFDTPKEGELPKARNMLGDKAVYTTPGGRGKPPERINPNTPFMPTTPTTPSTPTTPTNPATPANPANPAAPQPGAAGNNLTNGAYNTARLDAIQQMYDAQRAAREAELKSAYEQNLSQLQSAQGKLAPMYQGQANDLSAQHERDKRNFNLQASANGINTGAGSQAALAQNSGYLRSFGNLRASEAEQTAEYDRKMADLLTQHNNSLASANAENDYQRAGAMLDEYNNAYQRDLQNAQNLAQYGDFSLFAQLYGQEQADSMLALWIAQNPDLAYNSGRITKDQYKVITGRDPAGWKATGVTLKDLVDGMIPAGMGRRASGGSVNAGGANLVTGRPGPSPGYEYSGIYADPNTRF